MIGSSASNLLTEGIPEFAQLVCISIHFDEYSLSLPDFSLNSFICNGIRCFDDLFPPFKKISGYLVIYLRITWIYIIIISIIIFVSS